MVRKMLGVLAIGILGLFAFGGVGSAATAAAPAYPAPPAPGVTVNVNITVVFIVNGGVVNFFGSGFDPLEGLDITVVYSAPSGLRGTPALAESAATKRLTAQADSSGNFSTPVTMTQAGVATLTATGLQSGKSASMTVEVFHHFEDYYGTADIDCSYDVPQSVEQAILDSDPSDPNGLDADNDGWACEADGDNSYNASAGNSGGTDSSSGGLATTGASIAGPIAIGSAALLAGLAMLFFGTRGVMRRKASRSDGTA